MKKTPWLLFALLVEVLLVSVLAQAFDITTYTDGTSTGNFTYNTGTEWFTKSVSIPSKSLISNAYLYLNGTNITVAGGVVYLTNVRSDITQAIEEVTWANLPSTVTNPNNMGDANWATFAASNGEVDAWHQMGYWGNFTKPENSSDSVVEIKDATIGFKVWDTAGSIIVHCYIDNTTSTLLIYSTTSDRQIRVLPPACFNNSLHHVRLIFFASWGGGVARFYDVEVNYTFSNYTAASYTDSFPKNVTLILNNLTELFNYGSSNGSILNHKVVANITNNINFGNQQNISFLSNASGILEYSGLFIRYNNILNLSIYDEVTGALIAQNITIEVYKGTSISYYWTTNGTIALIGNFDGDYSVAAYNNNYSKRYNTVSFTGGEYRNLSIYLANTSGTVTFTIQDQYTGEVIENAIMSIYRIIGTSWQLVESKFTDVTGKATFGYTPNIRYRFDVTADEYENKTFYLDPIIYASYSVNMIKTSDAYYMLDYEDASISLEPTEFKNNQKNIIYINVSSATGTLQSYTLFLQYPGGSNYTFGWVPIGENFVIDFNITNAGIFDRANLTFSYTVNGILRTFVYQLPINEEYSYTLMSNRTNPLGIGWFERILLATFALIILAGFSMAAAGTLAGGAVTIFMGGILVYIHWLPYWAFVPLGVVGGLMIYSGAQS